MADGKTDDIERLTKKIRELEAENKTLRLCIASKASKRIRFRKEKGRQADWSTYPRRHVALKLMYLGHNYHGFASQANKEPTIESVLFSALKQSKLLVHDSPKDANYARCGRTDKGVSAHCQVVSLLLRSKIQSNFDTWSPTADRVKLALESRESEAFFSEQNKNGSDELDYVAILNRALPGDIRVMGWSPVPPGFSARFSCKYREYLYFFVKGEGLNIQAMQEGARLFEGPHDFRNVCKMDARNISNYNREILSFRIEPCDEQQMPSVWHFRVRGTAFLWHQVRCMVAILFLIGRGLESPQIVSDILDLSKFPRKPQFAMAPEAPLVLHHCGYQGLGFRCIARSQDLLREHLTSALADVWVKSGLIFSSFSQFCGPSAAAESSDLKQEQYAPLSKRLCEPSYEERLQRLQQEGKLKRIESLDCSSD